MRWKAYGRGTEGKIDILTHALCHSIQLSD